LRSITQLEEIIKKKSIASAWKINTSVFLSSHVTVEIENITLVYFCLDGFRLKTVSDHVRDISLPLTPNMVEGQNCRVASSTIDTIMSIDSFLSNLSILIPTLLQHRTHFRKKRLPMQREAL
jgi:hypothetical protein